MNSNPSWSWEQKAKPVCLELIDEIKAQSLKFSHLLIDSWYGNSPDFIKEVEAKGCLYITAL